MKCRAEDVRKPVKHACCYCGGMFADIRSHYTLRHSWETEVAAALALPKYSRERDREFRRLRGTGDHRNNTAVLNDKGGQLIVRKQRTFSSFSDRTGVDFCRFCSRLYSKEKGRLSAPTKKSCFQRDIQGKHSYENGI